MNFKITWKNVASLCLALIFSSILSLLLNNKALGLGIMVTLRDWLSEVAPEDVKKPGRRPKSIKLNNDAA